MTGAGRFLTTRRILGMAAVVLAVVAYALIPHPDEAWMLVRQRLDRWEAWVQDHPRLAVLLYITVYVLLLTPPIPLATVTALVGGALFGRWWGAGVLSVAAILSATLSFLAARYLFRNWVQQRFPGAVHAVNRGIEQDGGLYLAMLRMIPLLPFFLINMSLGLTAISTRKYIVISWISMLPFSFLFANAGTALREMQSPRDVFSPGVVSALALLACTPMVFRMLIRWIARRRNRVAA